MSKHYYKKSRLKYVLLASVCATAFAFSGIAAACSKDNSTSEDDNNKTPVKEDTQLLKNGNFEIFTIPEKKEGGNDPIYLIKTPQNWTRGGTSSYTMSGIISTSEKAWEKMTADDLAADLDYNNDLDSSSSDYLNQYIDYNGMKSTDVLYKNQYEALRDEDDYEENETPPADRKDRIENPGTHYNVIEKDGKLYTDGGNGQEVFVDEKGEYFLEYDKDKDEYKQPISNILMLHNYATSRNGIAQTYSSVEVELPANTAAEISVWVKTSYLRFSQGTEVKQDRGANISVTQTVGSSTIDKFTISCINTEKLLGKGIYEGKETAVVDDQYNGWLEYTVYVNACDFASSKIKLELGLGESGYTTEGYAFFDDVSVTKYSSLDKSDSYNKNKGKLDKDNTCNLSSDASEKIFKADSYKRNDGQVSDERNSEDFHYYIDLASERSDSENENTTYKPVSFANAKVGYTVDSDDYVSSKNSISSNNLINFTADNVIAVDSSWKLPFNSDSAKITTSEDRLALVTTSATPFNANQTKYADRLNSALAGAANLPKNDASHTNNMLVLLSAYGAAYTSSFNLSIAAESYQIVSFWVKTSDMDGSTAATVKITELIDGKKNDDNTASLTIDTTDKVTNIGDKDDEKDIFDGWVQCFFFVKNELNEAADFTIDFSFGNTTIKGTDVHSYKYGYAALANMQTLNVDEDIFAYTGSGDNTASLTIVEDEEKRTHVFDDAYGSLSHTIKNDMVIPATYTGVNGGSSAVTHNGSTSFPYDDLNNNVYNEKIFTGLINKENFTDKDSEYRNTEWYNLLLNKFNASAIDALENWNTIFGEKSVQPLIIYNKLRDSYVAKKGVTKDTFRGYYTKDEDGVFTMVPLNAPDSDFDEDETYYSKEQVLNYGYIGSDSSVSANSYSTISVRVRVSKGAVAYVYLVDTSAGNKVHSFSTPSYSFYYDVEGNVLKAEPKKNATITEQRENILYHLREDGLYEDKDGKLFANIWNYKKSYYDQTVDYYDIEGNKFNIEELVDGVTYYTDATHTKEADHYLVTGSDEKIYEYKDGKYYYIVDGVTQKDALTPFDRAYARYSQEDSQLWKEDYAVEIKGSEYEDWVTVNFIVHAGSQAKSYRLELWSGKREEAQTEGNGEGEFVLFDYSYLSVSDDTLRSGYESEIIKQYQAELAKIGKLDNIDSTDKNIAYYEKLAKENNIEIATDYEAHYYTYSLYDSADFKPFNKTVASEGASGYDYSVSDQSESLAYLRVDEENAVTVFTDYTNVDKSITLNEGNDNTTDDDNNTEEEDTGSDGSIWLLASSIILVIALVFAIIAIFLKDFIKKRRRNKVTSKNNYNQRRTNHYKRKLGLKNEEIVEVENTAKPDEAETPVEEAPAENEHTEESIDEAAPEVEETKDEAPVEEAPAPIEEEKADNNSTEEKPEDNQE